MALSGLTGVGCLRGSVWISGGGAIALAGGARVGIKEVDAAIVGSYRRKSGETVSRLFIKGRKALRDRHAR